MITFLLRMPEKEICDPSKTVTIRPRTVGQINLRSMSFFGHLIIKCRYNCFGETIGIHHEVLFGIDILSTWGDYIPINLNTGELQ